MSEFNNCSRFAENPEYVSDFEAPIISVIDSDSSFEADKRGSEFSDSANRKLFDVVEGLFTADLLRRESSFENTGSAKTSRFFSADGVCFSVFARIKRVEADG